MGEQVDCHCERRGGVQRGAARHGGGGVGVGAVAEEEAGGDHIVTFRCGEEEAGCFGCGEEAEEEDPAEGFGVAGFERPV